MLRVKEVAAALGVHPATVYRLIEDGELKAVRSGRPRKQGTTTRGGAIRIPTEALEAHLARAAIATGV
ncbi:DNA-binding protein [Streptomyces sp. SDr-06]|uniref:helix-turn-helix domain-containing protein n=1 Tax=Streptomyces sp. SDr-06 TaxID=2267702 RepID=UPI000DEAA3F6|nr:helix-turn-helix domain-containing protein [Streptomyces sp. SDr-06]RCH65482.1 DNA-binding protein [Streptomyces sp. SDr-06]